MGHFIERIWLQNRIHERQPSLRTDCLSRAPVEDPVDQFLDNKVYILRPFEPLEWALSYKDAESRDLFQKAFDKEENLRLVDDIIDICSLATRADTRI